MSRLLEFDVELLQPDGSAVKLGRHRAADGLGATVAAAKATKGTLRRLALVGYSVRAGGPGGTTKTLADLARYFK